MKAIVKEYMQTHVITIKPSCTVKEVLTLMIKEKTNGTVVVDEKNHVVGILSSWDIIKHIVPDYLETDMHHLASFEAADVFQKRVKQVANDPVSSFMTKHVHTAKADDTIISAIAMLAEFHIRQLPVVDKHDVLVGYINRTDMKRAAADVLKIDQK